MPLPDPDPVPGADEGLETVEDGEGCPCPVDPDGAVDGEPDVASDGAADGAPDGEGLEPQGFVVEGR